MADVSIIILNWNTYELVRQCIHSIETTCRNLNVEVVLVDNGSTDGSLEQIEAEKFDIRIIRAGKNLGFAGGNNLGAGECKSEFLLLLNSDAFLQADALQNMLETARKNPKMGLIGAYLRNPDGTFQASYTRFPNLFREFLILSGLGRLFQGFYYPSQGPVGEDPQRINGYVEGACMLVRNISYRQIGGFDTRFFMYAEDVDLCYRMYRMGWEIWYHPKAFVIHLGGGSSQNRKPQREADLYRSRIQFFRFHYGTFAALILKLMIFILTLIKWILHSGLRIVSRGKRGRQVVSPISLVSSLKGA